MVVYENLSRRSSLGADHFHVVGHGANHPIYSNATDTGRRGNQRVEIVIYPDRVQ
jgi:outer membrane protein OmpA-like peptidoglycan-associated protein